MPHEQIQDDLSLEQVENDVWGDPPAGATRLVVTVHHLRSQPIRSLSTADLRLLIGQQVGLDVLVPRALTQLEREPLVTSDFYPGDLLTAVLRIPRDYWSAHPAQLAAVKQVVSGIDHPGTDLEATINDFRVGFN